MRCPYFAGFVALFAVWCVPAVVYVAGGPAWPLLIASAGMFLYANWASKRLGATSEASP